MTTIYPAQIDNPFTLPIVVDSRTPLNGVLINGLRGAIVAIEQSLGVNPAGSYGTVVARLIAIENSINNNQNIILGGDLGGTRTSQLVIGIQGRPVTNNQPDIGQVLTWDGLAWTPIFPVITEAYTITLGGAPAFVEIGSALVNPIFTATYSQTPQTATIIDNQGNPSQNVFASAVPGFPSSPPNIFVYNQSYEFHTPASVIFTLFSTIDGGLVVSNTTFTINWTQRLYYGTALPGGNTAAFIQSLPNNPLTVAEGFSFTTNAGPGQAIYFAYRAAYGLADFWVNGFEGGFNLVGTIPVTNAYGFTENYYLYQSSQVDLGVTEISVLYPSTTTLASLDFYNPSNGVGNLLGDVIGSTNSNTVMSISGDGTDPVVINANQLQFSANPLPGGLVSITQVQATSGDGMLMDIISQSAATSGGGNGGTIVIETGTGDGAGVAGTLILTTGDGTTFLELIPITGAALTGNLTLGSPLLTFVASPGGDVKISQAQAASGIGAPMLITAQAAATGSNAHGGNVVITGGALDGSGGAGTVSINSSDASSSVTVQHNSINILGAVVLANYISSPYLYTDGSGIVTAGSAAPILSGGSAGGDLGGFLS